MKIEIESSNAPTHTIHPHITLPICHAFLMDPNLVSVTYTYQNGDTIVHTIVRGEEGQ
jgi:hypothetical protein